MGVCGIFRPPVQGGSNELISKFLSSMILYNHSSHFKSGEINSCRLSPLPTFSHDTDLLHQVTKCPEELPGCKEPPNCRKCVFLVRPKPRSYHLDLMVMALNRYKNIAGISFSCLYVLFFSFVLFCFVLFCFSVIQC